MSPPLPLVLGLLVAVTGFAGCVGMLGRAVYADDANGTTDLWSRQSLAWGFVSMVFAVGLMIDRACTWGPL